MCLDKYNQCYNIKKDAKVAFLATNDVLTSKILPRIHRRNALALLF